MDDEYISRTEVLNVIDTAFESGAFDGRYAYENLVDAITNLIYPLQRLQRPKGKWQEVYAETDYRSGWIEFSCECCEYQHGLESGQYGWSYGELIPWKYCPICGADMKGGEEDGKG